MNSENPAGMRVRSEYKHSDLTDKIVGAYYEVYNELGFGFLESVYEEAMTMALQAKNMDVQRQVAIPVWFRGQKIGSYEADLVIDSCVLVELKACKCLDSAHEAQLLHYLRATDIEVGLLLNFGPKPRIRRLAFDNQRKKISANQRKSAATVFGGSSPNA